MARVRVPIEEPVLGTAKYDYADAFQAALPDDDARLPEDILRVGLEHAAWPVRSTIWIGHRYVLKLRLAPRSSPGHVLGWKIVRSDGDVVALEAVSPIARAVLVARKLDEPSIVLTTYLFFRRRRQAAALWTVMGPVHRAIAPYLLAQAADAQRSQPSEGDAPRAAVLRHGD